MRKMTAALVLLLGLNVLFCQGQERSLSSLMLQNESDTPRKQLKEILKQIQDVYKVNLLFETKVEGLTSSYQINPSKDINHALKELLAPFQLTFVRLNNKNYIIKEIQTSSTTSSSLVNQEAIAVVDSSEPRSTLIEKNGLQSVDPPTEVKGLVVDENGRPIVGATVLIKGTNIGCQTDNTGGFTIKIPEANKPLLMVSYIGMKYQEINVRNRTSIRVSMEKVDRQTEEIVVVGYGRQAKKDVVTAVSTIQADEIMQVPAINVGDALQGKINGAIIAAVGGAPGSRPVIMIRGNDPDPKHAPLIVLDGVPLYRDRPTSPDNTVKSSNQFALSSGGSVGMSLNDINPDDIESITVLKDNAATAVYGMQGAYGVLVITTKRGKLGKPQFTYTANFGWDKPSKFPEMLSGVDYAKASNEMYQNDGSGTYYSPGAIDSIQSGKYPWVYNPKSLYESDVQRNAMAQTHSLGASGGTEAVRYYVNGSIADQKGILAAYDYRRYSILSNLDIKLHRDLKLGLNMQYVTTNQSSPIASQSGVFLDILTANPLTPIFNKDGSLYGPSGSNKWANTQPDLSGYIHNQSSNMSVQANFTYTPIAIKGLTIKVNNSLSFNNLQYKKLQKFYKTFMPDAVSPTGYRQTGGFQNSPTNSNSLTEDLGSVSSYNTDLGFDYSRTFAKHNLGLTVLGTNYYSTTTYLQAYRYGLIDGVEIINGGSPTGQTNGGTETQDGRIGGVMRLNYSFAKKYYLEYTMRADASNHYAPGKRWGYFPGAAVSWRISEEKFIKNNVRFINDLKLRASIGLTGIDQSAAYSYYYNYNVINSGPGGGGGGYAFGGNGTTSSTYQPAFVLANSTLPNTNVTWGKSLMRNIGLDFSLWKNFISGTFDIYDKHVSNLQVSQSFSTPATLGISAPYTNSGEQHFSGFEVSLTNNTKLKRDMSLQTTFNFSYTNSRAVDPNYSTLYPAYGRYQEHGVQYKAYYKSLGLFQTQKDIDNYPVNQDGAGNTRLKPGDIQYADLNHDGKVDREDMVIINNTNLPPYSFGLNLTFQWKNFSVNTFLQGAGGNVAQFQPGNQTVYGYENAWRPESRDARYPRYSSPAFSTNNSASGHPSTFWLVKGDYIRFKNLKISYRLPAHAVKKIGLSNVMFSAGATNLWSWAKSGIDIVDPEMLNVNLENGGYYPIQRSLNLGVNVGF
ncbi:SusC/RagA family TonB-linked outer membrane protein [Pinibacter aurantiacus]|uniref:TonB-dependent receptor n=1 Tax=Pinibacter aurantiacus TaxID=2851599 RepID=A0A9E2SAM2_9BACT|nr:TonB-dependent receptor [Pinibacter aurantiacus]MBV4359543.1 TonB-dependent receptor [Pinibacter aurantiacus]